MALRCTICQTGRRQIALTEAATASTRYQQQEQAQAATTHKPAQKFNKGQHSIRVHDIIDAHDLKVNPLLTCATCTNASQKPARPPACSPTHAHSTTPRTPLPSAGQLCVSSRRHTHTHKAGDCKMCACSSTHHHSSQPEALYSSPSYIQRHGVNTPATYRQRPYGNNPCTTNTTPASSAVKAYYQNTAYSAAWTEEKSPQSSSVSDSCCLCCFPPFCTAAGGCV